MDPLYAGQMEGEEGFFASWTRPIKRAEERGGHSAQNDNTRKVIKGRLASGW